LDDDGGVVAVDVAALGGHRAGDITGGEGYGSEGHQEDGEDAGDGGDGSDAVSDSIRHNGR